MFEIFGRYATAKCFATQVEDEAVEQVRTMCDTPFTEGSTVRIMPDVHAGVGCTIGTTMTVTDKVVPNVVGVDIGCGMYVVELGRDEIDLARLDEACHAVPSGSGAWSCPRHAFDLSGLLCKDRLKKVDRIKKSVGTLGGGNHFIEVDRSPDGMHYLVIHSGSRNLGVQVANHYQKLAVASHVLDFAGKAERERLVAELTSQGRTREIEGALERLRFAQRSKAAGVTPELCWLEGDETAAYLADVAVCQDYARQNREAIATELIERAGLEPGSSFHTIHNYIDTDEMILRKGAIAAHAGELVLIPLNMRDGAVLARGRGNADWNFSAPHGAGRRLSRKKAHAELSLGDFARQMEGIYTTTVCAQTLDEAPDAYKSAADVLGPISETVDVVCRIMPVFNFKATS